MDDYEICYECGGYGDDYRIENGELISNCDDCYIRLERLEGNNENDEISDEQVLDAVTTIIDYCHQFNDCWEGCAFFKSCNCIYLQWQELLKMVGREDEFGRI